MRKSQKKEFQSEFKTRLLRNKNIVSFDVPNFWKIIENCDKETLNFVLGDLGYRLSDLCRCIDLRHPDVISIFDGKLKNEEDFSKECIEIIKLAEVAKEKKLFDALSRVQKMITDDMKSIIKVIDKKSKNRVNLRFLKDRQERDKMRLQKRMQNIDLRNLYKKGKNHWESLPNDFSKFIRFDNAYNEDLSSAEKKSKQYKELGCTFLAEEIEKTILAYKSNIEQSYFGFNRITIANAAAILAKLSGCHLQSFCNNWDSFDKEYYAAVKKDKFKSFFLKHLEANPALDCFPTKEDFYFYEPRIYPFHYFSDFASEETHRIIDFLDEFPEANGKPIFDQFGVIVSSIKYLKNKYEKFDFLFDNENLSFEKNDDLNFWLDKTLLKKKYFDAIIVAEKDGKTYFICFFS